MKEEPKTLRDFVVVPDGRIGLIVKNDSCPGVFRGHYVVWYGDVENGVPIVHHVCGEGMLPLDPKEIA